MLHCANDISHREGLAQVFSRLIPVLSNPALFPSVL